MSTASTEQANAPTAPEAVAPPGRRDERPGADGPSTSWLATFLRAFKAFRADGMTDWAAALTYYGLLSLFPALIALVAIVGVFGNPVTTTNTLTQIAGNLAPGSATHTVTVQIQSITAHRSASGLLLVVGIATSLWSASGYVGAFMRAANAAYKEGEGRPFWKLRPLQLAVTVGMLVGLVVISLAVVLTGSVVRAVASPLGIGHQAVSVWDIAKWPVVLGIAIVMLSVLYYASPNVRVPRFRLLTPGAIFGLVVWLVASVGFAFYVANFGSYNKTYGTLGGMIALLVWMWISNCALLLGLELNAEAERSRELRVGVPGAESELQLAPRDEPDEPDAPDA